MSDLEQWFISVYDEFVDGEGEEGATVEESRAEVARQYAEAVEQKRIARHTRDLTTEGRDLFDKFVKPARTRRRQSFRADIQFILDDLAGKTILGRDHPIFSEAFPVGDGRDKTLGFWTADDWQDAINERNSNAVAVAAAAHEFQIAARSVIARLQSTGASITSDLFRPDDD